MSTYERLVNSQNFFSPYLTQEDLSRLGRNTIDTGYYIEQYFRIRSIRFIAVNENFDTANPEDAHSGIIIPLRNMINEAYALDIGRKIRAQQRQAMKDGKFIGARTPYGYLINFPFNFILTSIYMNSFLLNARA